MANDYITRSEAEALIPTEVSREIITTLPEASLALKFGRRLPNMTRYQRTIPVLNALVTAGFVNGDTGLKSSSAPSWTKETITAEEVAVIVPIPEAVLDDADYDIWGEIKPHLVESLGAVIDAAVFHGTNKPTSWPNGIVTDATSKSQTLDYSTHIGTTGNDIFTATLGSAGIFQLVEVDGYTVNGVVAAPSQKSVLRGLRDSTYKPFYMADPQSPSRYLLDGVPVEFCRNGALDATAALMIAGDWNYMVYAIRQDVTYKVLDQAVIQDQNGNIVYNLAQQDMVALRVVMRLGWARPNPANRVQATAASRYPFAVLIP